MTPRRTILRELSRHGHDGDAFRRPAAITGFDRQPARYQAAVNTLLQERLINGTKDEEGRLAIAINRQRIEDVRRELRPFWLRPVAWIAALAVVLAGAAVALI